MTVLDKAFANVKKELLKGVHGRVLDVGCGGGNWLKYFGAATSVTELEPNPYLIPKIEESVAAFRSQNPNIEIEVVNKFVHELDQTKPYDVSSSIKSHLLVKRFN
jgi:SAM-dependent methyltransferase